jgi:hypothetical protein
MKENKLITKMLSNNELITEIHNEILKYITEAEGKECIMLSDIEYIFDKRLRGI